MKWGKYKKGIMNVAAQIGMTNICKNWDYMKFKLASRR